MIRKIGGDMGEKRLGERNSDRKGKKERKTETETGTVTLGENYG